MFAAFDIESIGLYLDIYFRMEKCGLQMLETWLSKEDGYQIVHLDS